MPTPPTPQRFASSDYVITTGQSISIPLHIIPLAGINPAPPTPNVTPGGDATAVGGKNGGGGDGGYKIGIVLTVSVDGQGTTAPLMYEFDTGGQGFWVNPTAPLQAPPKAACTINITYTSGMHYYAVPTAATLAFTEASAALSVPATVGLIGLVEGPQVFPIFKQFWGDFGAALQGFSQDPTSLPVLLTALAQLPGNYGTGFIVDVGPYPGDPAPKGAIPAGQLIVGLTDQLRTLFPNTLPMAPGVPYTQPGGGSLATYLENIINGNLFISGSDATSEADNIGVVFDTGAPSTEVHRGSEVTFGPQAGDQLQLTPSGSEAFSLLSFPVGTEASFDKAGSSTADVLGLKAGYINTGLNAFFRYPVMFDLKNGLIGFPSTGS